MIATRKLPAGEARTVQWSVYLPVDGPWPATGKTNSDAILNAVQRWLKRPTATVPKQEPGPRLKFHAYVTPAVHKAATSAAAARGVSLARLLAYAVTRHAR
jgi:predicted HicB family RNase H-like nuclease